METEDFARAYRAFAAKTTPVFEGNSMPDRSFLDRPFFDDDHRASGG